MPATKENLTDIISQETKTNADAIVFCFEDALKHTDIPKGIQNLNETFANLKYDPATGDVAGQGKLPYRFIRVRNLENYYQLMEALTPQVIRHIHGIVIPKFTPSNIREWEAALKDSDLYVMPTLETEDYFNPALIAEIFNRLTYSSLKDKVLVLRLGGNDLLRGLSMKRPRSETLDNYLTGVPTLYDTPIATIINQVMIQARYHGFELTAPVFEYFSESDRSAFELELKKDKWQGFVGKTAIHPTQCAIINKVFTVDPDDLATAKEIVSMVEEQGIVSGVSNKNQSMIEPTTHYKWAKRLIQ